MKTKLCRCGKDYNQYTSLQNCCIDCLAVKVAKKRINSEKVAKKVQSRELKAAKDKMKPLKYFADKAQVAFNSYIRARDGKICISCGTQKPDIQYCAGHFRTRGAASHLRYNEDNVHSQCNKRCNLERSGAIADYRPALIAKIGLERVEALENDNQSHKFTIDECQEIERVYKLKLKQLLIDKID
jgi:hypothetical protein